MTPHPRTRPPKLAVDVPAVVARLRAITRASTPEETYAALVAAVGDVPLLVAELSRVWSQLLRQRLRYANLEAAARATLAAQPDGEPDPLAYLTDELAGEWPARRQSTEDTR